MFRSFVVQCCLLLSISGDGSEHPNLILDNSPSTPIPQSSAPQSLSSFPPCPSSSKSFSADQPQPFPLQYHAVPSHLRLLAILVTLHSPYDVNLLTPQSDILPPTPTENTSIRYQVPPNPSESRPSTSLEGRCGSLHKKLSRILRAVA